MFAIVSTSFLPCSSRLPQELKWRVLHGFHGLPSRSWTTEFWTSFQLALRLVSVTFGVTSCACERYAFQLDGGWCRSKAEGLRNVANIFSLADPPSILFLPYSSCSARSTAAKSSIGLARAIGLSLCSENRAIMLFALMAMKSEQHKKNGHLVLPAAKIIDLI